MIKITQEEVMKNWKSNNTEVPLVSIRCITYNHERFIEQAIDGFLMQKTNFPFEIVIHDDASTDKTATIIREYETKFPKIIKPIYETENQYSKKIGEVARIIDSAVKGKYIAFCEGDDFWIDKNKLQKQISFLENNPKYGLCYTYSKRYFNKARKFSKKKSGKCLKTPEDLIIHGNKIPTATICIRSSIYKDFREFMNNNNLYFAMGDYPLLLYFAIHSRIHCIRKITSVYRVLEESASHFNSIDKSIKFIKSAHDVQKYFCKTFNLKISDVQLDSIYQYMYIWKLIHYKDLEKAKEENKKLKPYHFKSYILKMYLIFKRLK